MIDCFGPFKINQISAVILLEGSDCVLYITAVR